jgi:Xaa-Pro aminopeptidase
MTANNLDGLIIFGEHEDAGPAAVTFDSWVTNARLGSIVIFPGTGAPLELVPFPLTVIDHMQSTRHGDAMWIQSKNMRVGRDATSVGNALDELHLSNSVVGVVGLEPLVPWHIEGIVPYGLWSKILSRFPKATFKPVAEGLVKLIMVLGEEDLACMRHASDIGEAMARAMVETAKPGVPENEVYAAGMSAAYRHGTVVPWMHFHSGPEPLVSGPPTWANRPECPRILKDGDVIRTEIFSNYGMRCTQHQLSIAIGDIDPEYDRAAAVARACYDAGLQAIKPGARFRDVCEAMRRPLEEAGGWARGPQVPESLSSQLQS